MTTEHKNAHLSPGGYRALGCVAWLIGMAASGVATWWFILGALATETDHTSRLALIAAGVLLTVGQLTAFYIAAVLPPQVLRTLRWTLLALGTALFLFEVGSMALTQLALVQRADTVADASAARIGELQRAIEARRAVATGRRELATTQADAKAITAAARTLRQADEAEAAIAPLAAELQQLQAARRPTLTTLLGADNVALFATLRSALIGLIGLVFMSASGALFRTARGAVVPAPAVELSPRRRADLGPAAQFVERDMVAQLAAAPAVAATTPPGTAPDPRRRLHETPAPAWTTTTTHGPRRKRRSLAPVASAFASHEPPPSPPS